MGTDRASLLARRVPHDEVILGRAYIIYARNGGVGVAVRDNGLLGYRLHREKFGRHYLFVEIDWADHEFHGTAIPLRLLDARPPGGDDDLLVWLADREAEHRAEVRAAWRECSATSRTRGSRGRADTGSDLPDQQALGLSDAAR